jgi:hypothetical protein
MRFLLAAFSARRGQSDAGEKKTQCSNKLNCSLKASEELTDDGLQNGT